MATIQEAREAILGAIAANAQRSAQPQVVNPAGAQHYAEAARAAEALRQLVGLS